MFTAFAVLSTKRQRIYEARNNSEMVCCSSGVRYFIGDEDLWKLIKNASRSIRIMNQLFLTSTKNVLL